MHWNPLAPAKFPFRPLTIDDMLTDGFVTLINIDYRDGLIKFSYDPNRGFKYNQ